MESDFSTGSIFVINSKIVNKCISYKKSHEIVNILIITSKKKRALNLCKKV